VSRGGKGKNGKTTDSPDCCDGGAAGAWFFRPDVFGRRFHGRKSAGAGDGQILRNCDMDEVHAEEKPIDHDEEMERDAPKLG